MAFGIYFVVVLGAGSRKRKMMDCLLLRGNEKEEIVGPAELRERERAQEEDREDDEELVLDWPSTSKSPKRFLYTELFLGAHLVNVI